MPVAEVTDAASYFDSNLVPGATYLYRVRARNYAGSTGYSAEASVTLPSTGLAPALPVANLRLWLKADFGVAGSVGLWPDQSGRGNHARQTNTGQQPRVVPDAVSGQPVLRFDGAKSNVVGLPDFMNGAAEGEVIAVLSAAANSISPPSGLWRLGTASSVASAYPADTHER